MKVKAFWLPIACIIAMIPAIIHPQDQRKGTISGSVRDSFGASVAGVQISAQRSDGGQIDRSVSGNSGGFQLALEAGTWSLKFLAQNFKTAVVQNIVVDGEHQLQIEVTLIVGSESEFVTTQWVPKSAAMNPEATNSAAASTLKSLPLSSRNYTQAAGLASGVSSQVSNATAIGMNSQGVQVGSGSTSNYMMDGATIAATTGEPDSPGATNPDAIEANSVQSWSYSAGPERYSGANISVVTKSGSDALHGTLFEFVRNDIFNANDFFVKMQGHPEPVLKQNQFGLTFGGPLLRERSYFFLAYQGTRQSNGFSGGGFSPAVTLPSLPSSRSAATLGPAFCPANHIGDSRYATLFGGVQVACDGSNINSVAVNLLNLKLPDGNYVIPSSNNGTFQTVPYSIPATFREDQVLFNTDYVFSGKEKLTEKFFASNDPQLSNFTGSPNELPGFQMTATSVEYNGVVHLTSTLTDRLLNELRLSGRHNLLKHTPAIPFMNEDVGIGSIVSGIKQLDSISVAGLFTLGGVDIWDYTSVNQYAMGDQASWDHGKQSMHFGVEVDRRQWNSSAPAYARGSLAINSFADFLLGLPGCPPGNSECFSNPAVNGRQTNGTSYSSIYGSLGPANSAYVTAPVGVQHAFRFSEASGYFQDNIKLHPRLTLNIGLRWDYFGLPADSTGNNTNFWPSLAGAWSVPPSAGTYLGYVVPSNFTGQLPGGVTRSSGLAPLRSGAQRTNFVPRIGFSLQPLAKSDLTVRGGYGLFYDRPDSWIEVLQSMAAVPYAVPVGGTGQPNYAASWAQPFVDGALGWGAARSVGLSSGTSSNLILNTLDENFSVPLTQKWNIEIQKQFPKGITAVIGYAGAHSVRLQDASHQINVPLLASSGSPVNGITTNTVENAPLRVPFLGIAPNGLNEEQTQGSAKFNDLQAALGEHASNGLHVQAVYAFSKTLTDLGAAPPVAGAPIWSAATGMNSNNPLDVRQQYGRGMGAPQRLSVVYGWDFPWKFSRLTGKALNGWGFSGMTIVQSGSPLTLSDSLGGTIYGGAGVSRAQFCPGMTARNLPTPGGLHDRLNGYFNLSALADTSATIGSSTCKLPAIGDGTGFGNSGVSIILGPGQDDTDIALSKTGKIKESKVEFRMEFFNVLNHAQFGFPDPTVTDPTFGQINSTSVNPRLIQFALKYSF